MPNGDRTGPAGAGARTGRGMGYCTGNQGPGWSSGGGCGMGRRGRNAVPYRGEAGLREELEALRMQVIALGQQLAAK